MNIASRAKLFFVIIFFCIPILADAQTVPVGGVSTTTIKNTQATTANENAQVVTQRASAAVEAAQKEYDAAVLTEDNTKINNARTKLNQAKTAQTNASISANNSQVANSTVAAQAIASAQQRQADTTTPSECGGLDYLSNAGACLYKTIVYLLQTVVYYAAGTILYISALIFDYSIYFSIIRFGDFLSSVPVANGADPYGSTMYATWTIVRNLFNIIIVFQLLKFSIYKIIGRGGDSEFKKSIIAIIIFALFTNFSFFFTKTLIDLSNIVTLQFYAAAGGDPTPGEFNRSNISKSIMQSFGIQKLEQSSNTIDQISGGNINLNNKTEPFAKTITGVIVILFMMLIASFVLLQGAAIFIARAVTLIFVVMFSPLMFAKDIFGTLDRVSKQWWEMLLQQLYVAPIFLGLLFLTLKISDSNTGLLTFTSGNGGSTIVEAFFSFAVISGLLVGCVSLAKQQGGLAAKKSSAWGAALYGSVVGGAAGYAGRKIIGRGAERLGGSERLKNWATEDTVRGAAARRTISVLDTTKTASFDFRNSDTLKKANSVAGKYGLDLKDAGKGTGVGGFVKERTANEKTRKEAFETRVKLVNIDTSRISDDDKKKEVEAQNKEREERFLRNKALTGREDIEKLKEKLDDLDPEGDAYKAAKRRNETLEKDFKKAQGILNQASTITQDVRFKFAAGEKTNYDLAEDLSKKTKKANVAKRQADERDSFIKGIATKEDVLDSDGKPVKDEKGKVKKKDRDLTLTEPELQAEFTEMIRKQRVAQKEQQDAFDRATDAIEKGELNKKITEHKKEIRKLTNYKGSIKKWVKTQEDKEKEAGEKKDGGDKKPEVGDKK